MSFNSFDNYYMSWKPTLKNTKKPLYIALAEQLETDIKNGILLPGTKLPPQRELADFLDINFSTVTRAFKICSNKGLISSTVGSGTFISYDVNSNILFIPERTSTPLIEMGSLMPDLRPQKEVVELLQKMLAEPECKYLFHYSYPDDLYHKEAAAQLLRKVGIVATDPNRLLFASGGQNSISAVFSVLFKPGDRVGVDPIVYPGVKGVAKLFGIQLVPIKQENGEISEEGLMSAYKNESIKGLYLIPDLHNPTNHNMSLACRQMIARKAKELDLIIIEDGISSLLLENPSSPIATLAPENTVYMLSLSKSILPALRLSYLYMPARFAEALNNALYHFNISQSPLLLELASRLIVTGKVNRLLEERRNSIRIRNQLADHILQDYPAVRNENSLCRWLLLPDGITGMEFEHRAREKGVSVYGSERFAVGKASPVAAARIALCSPETMEELEQGLTVIKELLNDL